MENFKELVIPVMIIIFLCVDLGQTWLLLKHMKEAKKISKERFSKFDKYDERIESVRRDLEIYELSAQEKKMLDDETVFPRIEEEKEEGYQEIAK